MGLRWAGAALLLLTAMARAELRLPKVISAHGVLQREQPIHIWGWAGAPGAGGPGAGATGAGASARRGVAEPATCVRVEFHAQTKEGCADRLGMWSVYLDPETAGGPYTLTVTETGSAATTMSVGGTATTISVGDLLVGDVWFASGQSNMEMPLKGFNAETQVKDSAKEIAAATHSRIRLLRQPTMASAYPMDDVAATWTECTPETARDFSAVAYFFGREIADREKVPVGLIDSSWGGTPIESWISLGAIGRDAALMPLFASRAEFAQRFADRVAAQAADDRETAEAKQAGRPAPRFPWHPGEEGSWNPGYLYNGMVAPFTPYTLRGFLWYQGEANTDRERAPLYARELRTLIADWRAQWREGDLPFLYAQISSFNSPAEDWGTVRDAERQALDVRGTAMAVTLDVGTPGNVHPPDKQTVGHRLALGARAESYGERVEWSGPLPRTAYRDGKTVEVWFAHADGLRAGAAGDGAGEVKGFELAGPDGVFMAATARVQGSSVFVQRAAVPEPRVVRYAWPSATEANLSNGEGLPASTFRDEVGGR